MTSIWGEKKSMIYRGWLNVIFKWLNFLLEIINFYLKWFKYSSYFGTVCQVYKMRLNHLALCPYFLKFIFRIVLFVHSKVYWIFYPLSHTRGTHMTKKIPKDNSHSLLWVVGKKLSKKIRYVYHCLYFLLVSLFVN